jgi:hypothetical protein
MPKLESARSRALSSPISSSSRNKLALRIRWTINVAIGIAVTACGSDEGNPSSGTGGTVGSGGFVSTGGTTSPGTGGTKAATGGTVATGGTTGGTTPTGGTVSTGGTVGQTGGASAGGAGGDGPRAPTGGTSASGGTSPSGGTSGSGGKSPSGGAGGTAGASGGAATGGTGGAAGGASGTCQKGTTKGSEVLFIGESFVQASTIPEETAKLAQAAGSLKSGEQYVDKSVSGTWIGNGASNSIPNQYKGASSGVRFVIMNGGGNDCWQGGKDTDRTNALNAAKSLFQEMAKNNVEKVVYHFYPDPIGNQFMSLTACLNLLRPDMKALCEAQTAPKCYWVDLRETWNGHPEYTSDGIHVAGPGNAPTAAAIYKSMSANCVAP